MNSDQLQGKWKQMKGSIKERWGKLTDDDFDIINGQSDQLVGKIQEKYGIAKEEAQRQVDEWMRSDYQETDTELERRRAS
ncbi:MAG: CsbD family protein [Terriglobales bacterium]